MTKAALEGSIRKWRAIVEGTGSDKGAQNCPLCHRYIQLDCTGCPVKKTTGRGWCIDSPYEKWENSYAVAWSDNLDGFVPNNEESYRLARKELEFLIGLRRFYRKKPARKKP